MSTIYQTLKSEKNKEQFVRDAYIELYSATDVPPEIDQVEFSEPSVEPAILIEQYSTYDVNFTMEIGYRRKEQYIEEERYYDSNLKTHRTRNVVKERTVTDWQPYQGSKNEIYGCAYDILHDGDSIDIGDKEEAIASQYKNYPIDVAGALKNAEHDDANLEDNELFRPLSEAEQLHLASVSVNDNFFYHHLVTELPGDEHRNFRTNFKITESIAALVATERYKLAFDYEGHKCFIKQCATELLPTVYCSYEYADEKEKEITDQKKNEASTDPSFQRNAKLYKYLTLGSFGLFFLSVILSGSNTKLGVFGIIASIVLFTFTYFVFGKTMKKQGDAIEQKYEQMLKEHRNDVRNKKMQLLNERFAKMGLEPLSENEVRRFFRDHTTKDYQAK